MQTQLSFRNYFGLGRTPRLILVGLLILALTVGGVVVGSQLLRQEPLPPPFGLAGNGLLAANVNGEIVLMKPDGSNAQPLVVPPFEGVTGTSFSRDGTRIAAWATPDAGRGSQKSLIVANADGSEAVEVDHAKLVGDPGFRIAWSPDDRRLAFSGSGDRLYVADIDARTINELGPDESIKFRKDPAWAPDGRLAYQCTTSGVPHLCVMSADFQVEQMLQTSAGTEYAFQGPSWSHDGRSIAYQVDDTIDLQPGGGYGWDVATIDVVTGKEKVLTRGFADHTILPVWSPDDRHVLFITAGGPGVVRSDGTGLRILGQTSCASIEPSPDGALATCPSGNEVVLYPIEGGGQPTVIELGGPVEFVNWQRVAN